MGRPPTYRKPEPQPWGGLLIIGAMLLSVLLWADLTSFYIWLLIFVTLAFGAIGFWDDYLKVMKKHNRGLSGRGKFLAQVAAAALVAALLFNKPGFELTLTVPFFKEINPDLGWFFLPLAIFVIVGAANAVNLTDGLDGLAIGPVTIAAAFFMVIAYLSGNIKIADYLQIPYVRGVGELAVFCGALVGAGIGFLWFNSYPAEVFMGDVGALALGGESGHHCRLCQTGDSPGHRRRHFCGGGPVGHLAGQLFQGHQWPPDLPHGPHPSSF